ncbi:ATP-binding cassette domain-containing protein [Roseovarius aquimarinus]|uniref:ATP-binding cassette domain-containing protein n=1 Tax=Roseovarius aquimarinus TaxID=1229156 RepID=A0ABW7I637_9RHOB
MFFRRIEAKAKVSGGARDASPLVMLDAVSKSFNHAHGRHIVLDRADLVIRSGEVHCILAAPGAGKTTLLNLMAGAEQPDAGRVVRRGRVSVPLGSAAGVIPDLTGRENCRHVAAMYGFDRYGFEAYVQWLSALGPLMDLQLRNCSASQRAQLVFAMTLGLEADLYLLEDGLPMMRDAAFAARAGRVLRERLSQAAVLVISSQPKALKPFGGRVSVLRAGKFHPGIFPSKAEAPHGR